MGTVLAGAVDVGQASDGKMPPGEWALAQTQHENTDTSRPRTRYSHSATLVGDKMVVTHGYFYDHKGRGPQWLDDSWIYDMDTGNQENGPNPWRLLNGGGLVDQAAPHGRMSHTSLYHQGKFLLFGGDDGGHRAGADKGYKGTYLSDLWELNVKTGAWTEIKAATGSAAPDAGYAHHSAVGLKGSMLIFGGLKRDELWQYWISSNVWERIVPADGPAPGKRHGQGAVEDPAGDGFYLFGGYSFKEDVHAEHQPKTGPLDDLWHFGLTDNRWTKLEDSHPAGGRTYPSMMLVNLPTPGTPDPTLLLFAGANCQGSCTCFGDTWSYSLLDKAWKVVPVKEEPITRYKQSTVLYNSAIYTFGGESYKPYMYHNSVTRMAWASIATQQSAPFNTLVGSAEGLGLLAIVTTVAWVVVYRLYRKEEGGQDDRKNH